MQPRTTTDNHPKTRYRVPFRNRLARFFIRPLFRLIFHLISRVMITGKENIPGQGAYLIAANHVSLFEPPFLLSFWPTTAPEAIAAVEIWEKPGQSLLVRLYAAIQIRRGEYDRRAVQQALDALNSGKPVLIFPEGGRTHKPGLRRAQQGSAFLIEKTGVPVVPVGVYGTTDDFLKRAFRGERPRLELRIGKPFQVAVSDGLRGEERRRTRQAAVDQIMGHIAALLPPEYWGDYQPAHGQ
jgi:1-acyl-sn-glycerol-3-phosphate acyltransferase